MTESTQTYTMVRVPPRRPGQQTIQQYRRAQADQAIARIEECYRRGLVIPRVR